MKKRWWLAGLVAVGLIAPVAYIEGSCGSDAVGGAAYQPILAKPADQRPEARSLLTYPEWHIVYSADSFGRHLISEAPSAYPFLGDIAGFWSSYCAVNRAADPGDAGDAKVMLYTIGYSFSIEMLVKAVYENTLGRLSESIGGWKSPADGYARDVQQSYGDFMHETPWYQFGFGEALSKLWDVEGSGFRQWERRLALSAEYGVKSGYAGLIGWATGATIGPDETRMRVVIDAPPAQVLPLGKDIKPVGEGVYDMPRYARFTQISDGLSRQGIAVQEIAGNDDIFVTIAAPRGTEPLGKPLFAMPLADEPQLERQGVLIKVADLSASLASLTAKGAALEHVYDY
jgi:hypothetical protein